MNFGVTPCQEAGRYEESLEQAIHAEDLGFDSVWLYEHHLVDTGNYFPQIVGLTGYAVETERVRLGTGIIALPLHQPVRAAEDLALLDEISGGRLEVGLGLGYREEEFDALGVPFENRGTRFEEGIEILDRLWSENPVNFDGEHYQLRDVTLGIEPVQSPRPRFWIAGWAPPAVERAARMGDAWIAGLTADRDKLSSCVTTYRTKVGEVGQHDPETAPIAIERETFVARDPGDLNKAREALANMYEIEHLTWKHKNVKGKGSSFEELSQDRFLIGTPDEIIENLRWYEREVGATDVLCRFHFQGMEQEDVLRSMEVFSEDVIPSFR